MSKDYYKILGVEKNASQDEIKKAFRKLAHEHHPDKKGGDEAKFKEANEAYQTLSNQQKRKQYDQFGSAGPGGFNGGQGGFGGFDFSGFQQGQNGFQFDFGGGQNIDLDDILGSFFGGGQRQRRGRDVRLNVRLSFKESVFGVEKKISVPDLRDGQDNNKNKDITVNIPAGVENGQTLRVPGYGEQITDGQAGNVLVTILVEPHAVYKREGGNLIMDLDVKLTDAVLGAKYDVELLDGSRMTIKIPEGLASGQILRVNGKGIELGAFHKGNLYIKTHIMVPKKLSKAAKKAFEELQKEGL
jgi:molecular chaperone DnaJ